MRIKVLGASGSALPHHHLTSFLLNQKIVFDAGNLVSSLSIRAQKRIEHIFITHAHLDHIRDIPFLADNRITGNHPQSIHLYSLKEVLEDLKKHLLNHRIWPDFTVIPSMHKSILKLHPLEEETPFFLNGYTITPYRVRHTVPAVGYLVEREGRSFFYTGDTGPLEHFWEKFSTKPFQVLIIEVSFPNKMKELALKSGHLTPELLLEDLKFLNPKPKRIYLTHLKPSYGQKIERELKKAKDFNFYILKGGEIIRI